MDTDRANDDEGVSRAQVTSLALLGRMVGDTRRPSDVFPLLHEDAIAAAGGRCSVLVQMNPRTALLHPTSALGIDHLPPDPWMVASAEARVAEEAFANRAPLVIADVRGRMPDLAAHLGTCSALIVPLTGGERILGAIIDIDDFEGAILQSGGNFGDKRRDIAGFVLDRHHDRYCRGRLPMTLQYA